MNNKQEEKNTEYNLRGCKICCKEQGECKACLSASGLKFSTTDWLDGISNIDDLNIVEVQFKNTRKNFYINENNISLRKGDIVAVEATSGHDIGIVSLCGNLVKRQMKKRGIDEAHGEFKKLYRKARATDIEKWQDAISLEHPTMIKSRQLAAQLNLSMKIGDVEYQGDKRKAIFYYIADERVDFRKLIKIFAENFHVRIEMKQIGARQEAGLIGGIGPCGRELCCAQWLGSFISVTTGSARYQELSPNPQKLAGQCCKLKCCLNYELGVYMEAINDFPKINAPLELVDGNAYLVKIDVLKKTMYFSYSNDNSGTIIGLTVDRVKKLLELNRRGIKIEKLENIKPQYTQEIVTHVVGEDSITRFDNKEKNDKHNQHNNNNRQTEQAENIQENKTNKSSRKKKFKRWKSKNQKENSNNEK
jgi:cell fate regulator YaaT (PSP1 superfamily)